MFRGKDINRALNRIESLIMLAGSYRISRYLDPKLVDEAAKRGELGRELGEVWSDIQKILVKMAALPIAKIKRLATTSPGIRLFGLVYFSIGLGFVFTQILRFVPPFLSQVDRYLSANTIAVVFGSMVDATLLDREVFAEIEKHVAQQPEKFRTEKALKFLAQTMKV